MPVIDALKACYPEAKIDFLVNKRVFELIENYPGLNKVISTDNPSAGEIKSLCKENGYDLAVCVHPKFSIALGLRLGGVKSRLGTAYRWYSFLFNHKHYQHRKEAVKHELEYNIDLLSGIGCKPSKYPVPFLEVKDYYIDSVKSNLKSKGVNPENFIVIHIPSLGSAKVWSDYNFVKLINLLKGENGIIQDIVLTGTPDDTAQLEKVKSGLNHSKGVFIITDLNLKELAALLKLSLLFIGNSTGPIHIAAAVGTYCVGLYSPVKVESAIRWGPYTDNKIIFQPEYDDENRDVMDDIKPEEVFRSVKQYLYNKS